MLALYKYGFEVRAMCLHQPVCLSVAQCVQCGFVRSACMLMPACVWLMCVGVWWGPAEVSCLVVCVVVPCLE